MSGQPLTLLLDAERPSHAEVEQQPQGAPLAVACKRLVDIVGALALLLVLAPVIVIVAVAVKLDSHGPVLFAHRRLGARGRTFSCLKFRSMRADAEHVLLHDESLRHEYVSNGFKIPAAQDPRITRLGRLLRQSSLDELPQLFNVLWGDMALVGPRPIVPLEATYYGEQLPVLLSVRPGLTGAWAVSGRSEVGYPQRVEMELSYVRNWTFASDVAILLRTPWTVMIRRGAV